MSGLYTRAFPLDDIRIRAGGDGRTVEAYAAVFDTPTEVRDQDGHYMEDIDRRAYNKTLADLTASNRRSVQVLYHHGLTLHGTPSERGSVPIAVPLEIKADGRGLFTASHYMRSELADEVLELIGAGAITGYSFTGRMIRTDPAVPRGGFRARAGRLQSVHRREVGLREYGPTPFPIYVDAAIVGMRARLGIDDTDMDLAVRSAMGVHHTATVDMAWDADAQMRNMPDDAGAGPLRAMHAAMRDGADPDLRGSYVLPHHMVDADGEVGAANLAGVRNALARLSQTHGLSDATRAGAEAHLRAHLEDARSRATPHLGPLRVDTLNPGAVTEEPHDLDDVHSARSVIGWARLRADIRDRLGGSRAQEEEVRGPARTA